MLLTHLYEFFGNLLGCSSVGMQGFPAYAGSASMYEVHKFMVLDPYQVGYFIEQVGLAAASFGVSKSDIQAAASALEKLFDYRCSPKMTVVPAQGPQYQSVCTDKSCPLAMNATCPAQPTEPQPLVANKTLADGEGRMPSGFASMSASNIPSATFNAAVQSAPGLTGLLSVVVALLAL